MSLNQSFARTACLCSSNRGSASSYGTYSTMEVKSAEEIRLELAREAIRSRSAVFSMDPMHGGDHVGSALQDALENLFSNIHAAKPIFDELGGVEGILASLHVNPAVGIDSGSIPLRRQVFGVNKIAEEKQMTFWDFYRAAWRDKTIIMLSIASVVSLILGLTVPEPGQDTANYKTGWIEGFAILCSVLIVTSVTSINDYRKDQTFHRLTVENSAQPIVVLRDGKQEVIDVTEIVVGDIVHISPGLVMPVDGFVVSGKSIVMDESSVTGENDPSTKNASQPWVLAGTVVCTAEEAYVMAGAVGERSFGGKLLLEARGSGQASTRMTPLQRRLDDTADLIGRIGLSAALFLFTLLCGMEIVRLMKSEPGTNPRHFLDYFLLCVAVVVVAVPEGLPLAVTIALAYSQGKMHKDNNQVRRLVACETMGGATQICSDKTGTLTQNMMSVVQGYIGMQYFKVKRPGDLPEKINLSASCTPMSEGELGGRNPNSRTMMGGNSNIIPTTSGARGGGGSSMNNNNNNNNNNNMGGGAKRGIPEKVTQRTLRCIALNSSSEKEWVIDSTPSSSLGGNHLPSAFDAIRGKKKNKGGKERKDSGSYQGSPWKKHSPSEPAYRHDDEKIRARKSNLEEKEDHHDHYPEKDIPGGNSHRAAGGGGSGDAAAAFWRWRPDKGNKTDNALLDFVDRVLYDPACFSPSIPVPTSSTSSSAPSPKSPESSSSFSSHEVVTPLPHQQIRSSLRRACNGVYCIFPFTSDRKRMSVVIREYDVTPEEDQSTQLMSHIPSRSDDTLATAEASASVAPSPAPSTATAMLMMRKGLAEAEMSAHPIPSTRRDHNPTGTGRGRDEEEEEENSDGERRDFPSHRGRHVGESEGGEGGSQRGEECGVSSLPALSSEDLDHMPHVMSSSHGAITSLPGSFSSIPSASSVGAGMASASPASPHPPITAVQHSHSPPPPICSSTSVASSLIGASSSAAAASAGVGGLAGSSRGKKDEGALVHYVKGGSDRVLMLCNRYMNEYGEILPLDNEAAEAIFSRVSQLAREANRTIGIAFTVLPTDRYPPHVIPSSEPEEDLIWLGVIGIQDPLRPEVKEAVRKCQMAGVTVRMCTGDNLDTAVAISRQCGIFRSGSGDVAMTGEEFRQLVYDAYGDEGRMEKLGLILKRMTVMGRSQPLDKQLLVLMLMMRGEVVAVTGDGTNDAPALRLAHVGFVMKSGTDVAVKSADIVLLDDNFRSVQRAVVWGRCVNDNIRKFVQLQLSVNYVSVVLTMVGSVMTNGASSPLTTVQLLWVNLIMDTLAALALATEEPTESCLLRGPTNSAAPLISRRMHASILLNAAYIFAITLTVEKEGREWFHTQNPVELQTVVFNVFVLCILAHMLNCRKLYDELNMFEGLWTRSKPCIIVLIFCLLFQILAVQTFGPFMNVQPLRFGQWMGCVVFAVEVWLVEVVARLLPVEEPTYTQVFDFSALDEATQDSLVKLSRDVSRAQEREDYNGQYLERASRMRAKNLWTLAIHHHMTVAKVVNALRAGRSFREDST